MDQRVRVIAEYRVVHGDGLVELMKNVRLAIEDGFEPIGGIAPGEMRCFYQAVVKYAVPRLRPHLP